MEPRTKLTTKFTKAQHTSRWHENLSLLGKYKAAKIIDDFGLMFLTCSALSQLNASNTFNGNAHPKVCFYGRDYSSLFLEYVEKYTIGHDFSDRPFFAYTHLYTAHEHTGMRIVNDDVYLARFFHEAARLENTLTIFASDHGVKNGQFSTFTNPGRHEVRLT